MQGEFKQEGTLKVHRIRPWSVRWRLIRERLTNLLKGHSQ